MHPCPFMHKNEKFLLKKIAKYVNLTIKNMFEPNVFICVINKRIHQFQLLLFL